MIKLIVADMDGTLLNDDHQLHSDFWEIERTLSEKNILFAVASGRQYYNLESNFERIKDRMIFFAENGTHVVHKGQDLYINEMDIHAARKFIEIGRDLKDVNPVLCCKGSAYVECRDERFLTEIKKYYTRLKYVDDLTQVEDTVLKVTLCDWQGVEENSYAAYKEFENDFKVAVAARIFLDITAKSANKGVAIRKVQEKLNISPDETLVFGDYLNDLEMMQNATHSYAMKNAHPEIIKISRHRTEFGNNENGVLRTILDLGLIDLEVEK
ncbi:HAD family hydrolase [Antarcticibacterium flavum]|uniref:HAD family hydrolase n=1 Tax=Antarcticibacterium flavum TaxID=2058175 RepID=A0A5B7X7Z1_9FLAO|nr:MULTISPECIES: Cof-type HAD-IIB family hydrolase [Antarcticibacterium]MCM4159649.1 HAD family hydrolase [Antarcticibacterium sp. W02-3]QCY70892.1 HAD family hydrolase [Antarcticibacterium flavum]